jgi:hypothetical protein
MQPVSTGERATTTAKFSFKLGIFPLSVAPTKPVGKCQKSITKTSLGENANVFRGALLSFSKNTTNEMLCRHAYAFKE